MSVKIFSTILLILLINRAISAETIGLHVPNLNDNGVLLVPFDNKYYLRIDVDGTGREETVEEISPGQLLVRGSFGQPFPDSKYLLVTYEAGTNGYVAKYSYSEQKNQVQHLPPAALKTIAG